MTHVKYFYIKTKTATELFEITRHLYEFVRDKTRAFVLHVYPTSGFDTALFRFQVHDKHPRWSAIQSAISDATGVPIVLRDGTNTEHDYFKTAIDD